MQERFNTDKKFTFTKDEIDLLYYQLLARKEFFEEDMMHWASKKDVKEVQRCAKAIERIESMNRKLLNG